jgi:threonine/homoserine/homoserine lactone efflux protein
MLETAHPTGAFIAGCVLAIANPNVFLLLSGLGIVVTNTDATGEQVWGVVLLLGAVALDFAVPLVLFAVFGAGARRRLDDVKRWMVGHDRPLTLVLLFGFGLLFVLRGVVELG